jgi:outer membrane protein assembly factor BamB
MTRFVLLAVIASLIASNAGAEDVTGNWHQWRGPDSRGVAPDSDPPIEWDEQTNIKWKVEVPGNGSSTPIVWGNQVFILTAVKTDRVGDALPEVEEPETRGGNPFKIKPPTNYHQFIVMSFDRQTGKVLWQDTATEQLPHEAYHHDHGYASASPTTDGKHLYASFGSRGIYCYDMQGNKVWDRDLGDMQVMRYFGEGISPALYGDSLIVTWDHEGDSFVVCLDAKSGDEKWKVPRKTGTSWSTPLVLEHDGKAQVIISGGDRLHSYDLATGKVIWECGRAPAAAIPVPVATDKLVFSMTGYPQTSRTLFAVPIDSTGDLTDQDKLAWSRDRGTPYVPSPVLLGDTLYYVSSNSGILSSVNASTGDPIIDQKRVTGVRNIYSSPVAAAGRIYLTGRDGKTVVIKDGPELEVIATNELDDRIDASAAIAGDELFLRGKKYLYCISK